MSNISISQEAFLSLPKHLLDKLDALGIHEAAQLDHVDEQDLVDVGWTPVEIAELQRMAAAALEPPAPKKGKKGEKAAKAEEPMAHMMVQIVRREEDRSLVQWAEDRNYYRAWVLTSAIEADPADGSRIVSLATLEKAERYGDDWETILADAERISDADIAHALRERGIWMVEDLLANLPAAQGAFNAAHQPNFSRFVNAARKLKE